MSRKPIIIVGDPEEMGFLARALQSAGRTIMRLKDKASIDACLDRGTRAPSFNYVLVDRSGPFEDKSVVDKLRACWTVGHTTSVIEAFSPIENGGLTMRWLDTKTRFFMDLAIDISENSITMSGPNSRVLDSAEAVIEDRLYTKDWHVQQCGDCAFFSARITDWGIVEVYSLDKTLKS